MKRIILDDTKANRTALERVQALQDKARGYPRDGVRADGKPIPPGVPCRMEHWSAIERDAEGKRIALPVIPEAELEGEDAPKLDRLSTADESELKVAAKSAEKLPADWAAEVVIEKPAPVVADTKVTKT